MGPIGRLRSIQGIVGSWIGTAAFGLGGQHRRGAFCPAAGLV
jgi:hypothetical protein